MNAQGRTRFPFSYYYATSIEDVFELFEVKITVRCARGGASCHNCFLDTQLNGQGLAVTGN